MPSPPLHGLPPLDLAVILVPRYNVPSGSATLEWLWLASWVARDDSGKFGHMRQQIAKALGERLGVAMSSAGMGNVIGNVFDTVPCIARHRTPLTRPGAIHLETCIVDIDRNRCKFTKFSRELSDNASIRRLHRPLL